MVRFVCLCIAVLALFVQGAALAKNPELDALRQQVKVLRAEKTAVLKALKAQYQAIIAPEKLNEKQLTAQRKALDQQERQTLALTNSAQERTAIREQYKVLRHALVNQGKLDAHVVAELRAQEKVQVKQVTALYNAKIAELNNLIRAGSKGGKSSGRQR